MPRWRLKASRIASADGKPQCAAMRAIDWLPSVRPRRAASIRIFSTYFPAAMFIASTNLRAKLRGLIETRSASS